MKITANFDLEEFVKSPTASRLGIDNTPGEAITENIKKVITEVMQPIRDLIGEPVYVNSGYRCPALNAKVGGVKTSKHLQGLACDFTLGSCAKNKAAFKKIAAMGLQFDQLIDEYDYTWIHISISETPY
ncbi:D-Ala-D-Ala carboxypeptidase family metallohydrolase, partial [Candidatus Symbiothrix dinenymphae]|uniref:D-Ala-D-Ala carboxypeptidase family metallohydrolase n=1 Tax=Candidatus Symbiothrix dinenymphae TaxID=467085 RepID=UPI000703A271